MRRTALLSTLLLLAVLLEPAGAVPALVQRNPGGAAFMSPNVSYIGTLPEESPGIGGRVLTVRGQTRFYVSGVKGLAIYDVTNPASPTLLGRFAVPHWQNEDMDVSDDGNRAVVSVNYQPVRQLIFDTSDPREPKLMGLVPAGAHTSTCADAACHWLYDSNGRIWDARNAASVTEVGSWFRAGVTGSHALNRDAAGLLVSDSTPRLVLDPRDDPANPTLLASGRPDGADGLLQHNNVRPDADRWQPRAPEDDGEELKPGELLIGNTESNARARCDSPTGGTAGGLSTWSMRDFDKGAPLQQLHAFRPMSGTYADGNPAVNALGCSGHWFTVLGDYVAASWYEHGVRILSVDRSTGEWKQLGFFQPVVTAAGAAHWVTGPDGALYVYNADYARGVDVLRFDPQAPLPTQAELDASWLAKLGVVHPLAEAERYLCRLGST